MKLSRHATGTDETSWRRQCRRRDVAHGDDDGGDTATQTLVKATIMSATKTNDLDVLVLNDADVEAGEHNGLDVFNVDDEELNVLNDDDDAVDGTMIFQWSVKVSGGPR